MAGSRGRVGGARSAARPPGRSRASSGPASATSAAAERPMRGQDHPGGVGAAGRTTAPAGRAGPPPGRRRRRTARRGPRRGRGRPAPDQVRSRASTVSGEEGGPPQEWLQQGDPQVGPQQRQWDPRQPRSAADVDHLGICPGQTGDGHAVEDVALPQPVGLPWTDQSPGHPIGGENVDILLNWLTNAGPKTSVDERQAVLNPTSSSLCLTRV